MTSGKKEGSAYAPAPWVGPDTLHKRMFPALDQVDEYTVDRITSELSEALDAAVTSLQVAGRLRMGQEDKLALARDVLDLAYMKFRGTHPLAG